MTNPDWPHSDAGFQPTITLPARDPDPAFTHAWESDSVWAIRAALGARRPLLVLGEPGTGKSELARAAAQALKRPLICEVVTARTEPQDLHYRFDAVARLGQAQVLSLEKPDGALEKLEERRFLLPGPLWWAFNWGSACEQREKASQKGSAPEPPLAEWKWKQQQGCVLLLDEIDKADTDVPNGLLESLGQRAFQVPYLDEPIRCEASHEPPLVVITSNQERELPAAFLRRCLVLSLKLPTDPEALQALLVERGRAHFGKRCADAVYLEAARQVAADRGPDDAPSDSYRPGQAEYLDLLRAVLEIAGSLGDPEAGPKVAKRQAEVLSAVQDFALKRQAHQP